MDADSREATPQFQEVYIKEEIFDEADGVPTPTINDVFRECQPSIEITSTPSIVQEDSATCFEEVNIKDEPNEEDKTRPVFGPYETGDNDSQQLAHECKDTLSPEAVIYDQRQHEIIVGIPGFPKLFESTKATSSVKRVLNLYQYNGIINKTYLADPKEEAPIAGRTSYERCSTDVYNNIIVLDGKVSDKRFMCSVCARAFQRKTNLITHLRKHTGEKPFACNSCDKTFDQKTNLTRHLRVHTGERPYPCDICHKGFADRTNLTVHLRAHAGEKPFECDMCGKAFAYKPYLTAHLRTHTGEKPYVCRTCGRGFGNKTTLNAHLRTHSTVKPYGCELCIKAFKRKDDLATHQRTHTGDKPFLCKKCGECFARKAVLVCHRKTHKEMSAEQGILKEPH